MLRDVTHSKEQARAVASAAQSVGLDASALQSAGSMVGAVVPFGDRVVTPSMTTADTLPQVRAQAAVGVVMPERKQTARGMRLKLVVPPKMAARAAPISMVATDVVAAPIAMAATNIVALISNAVAAQGPTVAAPRTCTSTLTDHELIMSEDQTCQRSDRMPSVLHPPSAVVSEETKCCQLPQFLHQSSDSSRNALSSGSTRGRSLCAHQG